MPIAEGGCLCGGVRYEVRSGPTRVTACHCRFCQRATGAPFHVAAVFNEDDFSLTKGNPKIYEHVSDGSGKRIRIHFCDKCATKLYLMLERFPGGVGVYSGTFDDPNEFCKVSDISKHIFLESGRHGTVIPAGTEVYFGHAVSSGDEAIEPTILSGPYSIGALSDEPE